MRLLQLAPISFLGLLIVDVQANKNTIEKETADGKVNNFILPLIPGHRSKKRKECEIKHHGKKRAQIDKRAQKKNRKQMKTLATVN